MSLSASLSAQDATRFVRGDVNTDGSVDISDGVSTLLFLFGGGEAPSCRDAADSNDTATIDVSDAIYLFNYLFKAGPPPPAPFTTCGVTPDSMLPCDNSVCVDR